jgi:hypothetical protein
MSVKPWATWDSFGRVYDILGTESSGAPKVGETYNAEAPLRSVGCLAGSASKKQPI